MELNNSQVKTSQVGDPLLEKEGKPQQQKAGLSDYLLMLAQIVAILIWTFFAQYDDGVLPGTTKAAPNSNVYVHLAIIPFTAPSFPTPVTSTTIEGP